MGAPYIKALTNARDLIYEIERQWKTKLEKSKFRDFHAQGVVSGISWCQGIIDELRQDWFGKTETHTSEQKASENE